jgi:ketosteroid isomerase-like protein
MGRCPGISPRERVDEDHERYADSNQAVFTTSAGQGKPDEAAFETSSRRKVAAWNKGDAQACSQHFAADGTFANILRMFFTGHQAFRDRHEEIFKGMFPELCSARTSFRADFIRPQAADVKGRLRTRLLQVMVKQGGDWKITVYHNVDVKPGVTAPEPQ